MPPQGNLPLVEGIRELRDDPNYVDVVVKVEDRDFPCHKLVLAATSDFFRALFASGMKETLEGKIDLKEISVETFKAILHWMYYHDEILTETNMFDVATGATQLQVKSLILDSKDFIIKKTSASNCVRVLNLSKLLQWDDVEKKTWKFFMENFEKVSKSELNSLSTEDLKSLISNSDLESASEDSVVQKILDWVESDDDFVNPCSEQRVKRLAELFMSCRYLLVSLHFVWQALENNQYMQADVRCCKMIKEILRYKTQLDLHQQWCPQPAEHRKLAKYRNYIYFLSNELFSISVQSDPTPSSYSEAEFDYPKNHSEVTGIAYINEALYIETNSVYEDIKYLYVCAPNSKELDCLYEAQCSNIAETVGFLPICHSLVALRTADNHYYFERMNLPCTMSSKWSAAGRPETQGAELAHITNVGSKVLMFWKHPDGITMEWFDVEQQTSFISPDKFNHATSVATFRTADRMFVLQNDGVLWRVDKLSNGPHVELIQEKKLWNGEYQLCGAIVVSERLYVLGHGTDEDTDIDWSERYLLGVFDKVYTASLSTRAICCIHAVLEKND